MKEGLKQYIDLIEMICIALTAVFAFFSLYYFIGKNSIGIFIKLCGINKEKRRVKKNEKKNKD